MYDADYRTKNNNLYSAHDFLKKAKLTIVNQLSNVFNFNMTSKTF